MNTASQYFYLLRWLVFPSIFLSVIMALVIASAGVSLWLFLKVDPHLGKIFYFFAILFYTILLFNFHVRFSLLYGRKTITLTGVLAWRLTLIGFALVSLWSLAVAPSMSWFDESINIQNLLRATVLILSTLTLLIYIGALTRLNLLLIVFVILGLSLSDLNIFFAVAGTAWRQGIAPLYVTLLLLTLGLWTALYLRIVHSRLPRSLEDLITHRDVECHQRGSAKYSLIDRLMPRLKFRERIQSPESVLLLEATHPALAHLLVTLAGGLPLLLIFALLFYGTNHMDLQSWLPWVAVLVPMFFILIGIDTIAGNARRLWLLLPGGRAELFKQVERGYARSVGPGLIVFLALSITLMADQRPLWWLICWAALMPVTAVLFFYLYFSTVAWDHPMQPVVRFLLGMVLIAPTISIFWFGNSSPLFSTGLVTTFLVGALIARHMGRKRWLRMDYSMLGGKVARI